MGTQSSWSSPVPGWIRCARYCRSPGQAQIIPSRFTPPGTHPLPDMLTIIVGWLGTLAAAGALAAMVVGLVNLRRTDPGLAMVRARPIKTTWLLVMWVLLLAGSAA